MTTLIQRSFAGGELAPALYARVDTTKYATGLHTCRNFLVMRHGGVTNRPGTEFVAEVKDSSKTVRFIPFIFNANQTYVLEFGDQYMRVIRDGVALTDDTMTITGVSAADPGVVTYSGSDPSGLANGQEVYISGVAGALGIYLNNRNFKIASVNTGANTFALQTMAGANFNTTALGAYTSGGTAARVYTITTPYLEADLSELQFVQSADVITIVHPSYAPRELARTGHTTWVLSPITFSPLAQPPTSLTGGSAGTTRFYKVTTVAQESREESLPSAAYGTNSSSVTVTWTAPSSGPTPLEYNVYASTATDGIYGFIGVASANRSFTDSGIAIDTTDTPPSSRNPFKCSSITAITQANPAVVTAAGHSFSNGDTVKIDSVVGMTEVNGLTFTVAGATSTTIQLSGINSSAYTAYVSGGSVSLVSTVPSAVSYFQQRIVFANTDNDPEKVWTSRSGQFSNFTISSPLQDDDAVTFTLAGRQVNEVRHLVDLGKLIILTTGGEWVAEGDAAGILTPTQINAKQYSYNGSSNLAPIFIGGNILYVQGRGSQVIDFAFDYQVDGYRGNELTIFSAHLFQGKTLVDWTYQQNPNSIVWAVRDDGTLLGLTYVREHQVWGWHRHDFLGTVENACSIPEGSEDALYLVVKRTINGQTKRYIERLKTRAVDDIKDSVFIDSCLTYDGRNESPSHTMTLTSVGDVWTYTDTLTLTSSTAYFASTEVGNEIHLTGSDGTIIRAEITDYTSTTVVSVKPNITVPLTMRAAAISDWARAVDQVTGLWHLEGETVSIFADGFVVASPNNEAYTTKTIANGSLTLDRPYGVIHVGQPFISDVQTLDMDTEQSETLSDKKKIVTRLTLFVESSRGIWAGSKPPTDDDTDPLEDLYELKIRDDESYDAPPDLETGTVDIDLKPEWNSNGRIFIRQVDPLPLSVLAVVPYGMYPIRERKG